MFGANLMTKNRQLYFVTCFKINITMRLIADGHGDGIGLLKDLDASSSR